MTVTMFLSMCSRKWEEQKTEHALLDWPPLLLHEDNSIFGRISGLYSPRRPSDNWSWMLMWSFVIIVIVIVMVAVTPPLSEFLGGSWCLRVLGPAVADKRDVYILYIYIY